MQARDDDSACSDPPDTGCDPCAPIAVLGAGVWGTALSLLLARNGHPVSLWSSNPQRRADLHRHRTSQRSLPGVVLPPEVQVALDLNALVEETSSFLIAVPSHAFRAALALLPDRADVTVAWATKGLEPSSGKLLSEVFAEVRGTDGAYGVISGPTFAGEVARGLPAALTVASERLEVAETIAAWLRNHRVRVYTGTDVVGVQLGGAIKNVIALAAGISDGLGLGANTSAALITRGLAELVRLGVTMGGKTDTFMGLSGVGDLLLTCTDDTSRNRRVGLELGKGRALPQVLAQIGEEAEGVGTAWALHLLASRLGVDMPITEQVYRMLYDGQSVHDAVEALLRREPKAESLG